MSIFHRRQITFRKHDPLADGLGDMISAEQEESDHITLTDDDGKQLVDFWDGVSKNLKKDPNWFNSNNE